MQNARGGGPAQGALFWTWYAEGQRAPAEEGGTASGLFGNFEGTSTAWPAIQGFAAEMKRLSGAPVARCPAGAARAAAPAPDCAASRVGGAEGTGREGPRCDVDINECARGTAGCDPNAACTNTPGGFACPCYQGYAGDGTICQPTPELAAVQAGYVTDGPGRLACSEGRDVPYPEGAPGFAYDVTGALARVANGGQQVGEGLAWGWQPTTAAQS